MQLPESALLPYFTAGWPDDEAFLQAVEGAAEAGCPAFEVGFPFSDPVADGPVIQKTSAEALAAGVDLDKAFRLTAEATRRAAIPAVVMTYANLVWYSGPEKFCRRLAQVGAQGLIVPDLPLEEGEELEQVAADHGIDLIYLVAPTTPPERARQIARRTRGFLYLVSVKGVTGARAQLPPELPELIARVRESAEVPVLVGFGISTPGQAAQVAQVANGAIVGSALLRALEKASDPKATSREFLGAMVAQMTS